ncbi:MAG: hypothetical protein JWM16_1896 [Verrucomicrobiales bacterium]|nr:hypothetical protein [Verrucomicrobiales bacterium]
MNRKHLLQKRILLLTWFTIIGLVISGVTAIPLQWELDLAHQWLRFDSGSGLGTWLGEIREGLNTTYPRYPFIAYGTDWLAFGHFAIAIAFIGALKDPVRNIWLFTFGMIACVAIIPYAFVFGAVRQIPIFWRLIDCSFGLFGFVPLWLCRKYAKELEMVTA